MKQKKTKRWVKSWKGRLGPLQTEMMHLIFRYGKEGMPAGDIFEILSENQSLPKSSVYTVLNRLIKRGILERRKVDGIYHYCPLIEEKELGRFGSYEDKTYNKSALDLIARLIKREIAQDPHEIERLQKLLDEERSNLKQIQDQ